MALPGSIRAGRYQRLEHPKFGRRSRKDIDAAMHSHASHLVCDATLNSPYAFRHVAIRITVAVTIGHGLYRRRNPIKGTFRHGRAADGPRPAMPARRRSPRRSPGPRRGARHRPGGTAAAAPAPPRPPRLRSSGSRRRPAPAAVTASALANWSAPLPQGIDEQTVMAVMGWSERRMVQRYQHVIDGLRVAASGKLADLLYGAADQLAPLRGIPELRDITPEQFAALVALAKHGTQPQVTPASATTALPAAGDPTQGEHLDARFPRVSLPALLSEAQMPRSSPSTRREERVERGT